ncbi:MAG: hypothetical protein WC919_03065 [Candidatus Paceibacterota bacterium]|jgi:hypothetical protein
MRYFDRTLSEALGGAVLGSTALSGHKLQSEIKKLFVLWGREHNQDKQDQIADEIKVLRTEDNKDEWDKYTIDLFQRNAHNDKFIDAMMKKSQRDDEGDDGEGDDKSGNKKDKIEDLATWALRYLVDYSTKST